MHFVTFMKSYWIFVVESFMLAHFVQYVFAVLPLGVNILAHFLCTLQVDFVSPN